LLVCGTLTTKATKNAIFILKTEAKRSYEISSNFYQNYTKPLSQTTLLFTKLAAGKSIYIMSPKIKRPPQYMSKIVILI
jgi:hypothetical protein